MILSFPSKTAFPAGGREITVRMAGTLDKLSGVLKSTKGNVIVTGHNDNALISTDLILVELEPIDRTRSFCRALFN